MTENTLLHFIGILTSLVGLSLSFYFGRSTKRILIEDICHFNGKKQTDEFDVPVKSILKVKLRGKRKQKVRFTLFKVKVTQWRGGGQYREVTTIKENMKGNSKCEFDLEGDLKYHFVVQPDPYVPITAEFSVIEYRFHSDRIFQFGLALFTSGLVIYFAK
ncbi:hypothetical protein [Methanosarcina sp. UBA289]|uniref:hypothetical protein n=1 Tax=Methanosarcina sp. UBA289 TaxID=1915574 RepID=UPI0025DD6DDD|nr:hypothetical protein [Methanosarcina sp. UBA289]